MCLERGCYSMRVTVEEVAVHAVSDAGRMVIDAAVKDMPSFSYAVLALLVDLHPDKRLALQQDNIKEVVRVLEKTGSEHPILRARTVITSAVYKALYHE